MESQEIEKFIADLYDENSDLNTRAKQIQQAHEERLRNGTTNFSRLFTETCGRGEYYLVSFFYIKKEKRNGVSFSLCYYFYKMSTQNPDFLLYSDALPCFGWCCEQMLCSNPKISGITDGKATEILGGIAKAYETLEGMSKRQIPSSFMNAFRESIIDLRKKTRKGVFIPVEFQNLYLSFTKGF